MRGTQQRPIPSVLAAPDVARSRQRTGTGTLARVATLVEQNVFIVLALAACGVIQTVFAREAIKPDSWYTLLAGRLIARSGLPQHDTLTVLSHGRAWIDQQWLGQLGGYGLWRAGDWPLALAASGACFIAAFALATVAARLGGASERSTALVVVVCVLAGLPNTVFRTQIPAYVLFALVLLLLLRDERRPSRRVYLVFPLLVVWANTHGSVILGAGLVALAGGVFGVAKLREHAAVGDWLPRAAALLVAPWLCVLASPYAIDLPGYYRKILWNPAFSRIVGEWGPSTLRAEPIFFALLLAALWLAGRSRRRLTPFAQLALLATGIGGLIAIRNIVWFALVAAAVLPIALDELWPPANAPRRRNVNLALALVAAVALGASVAVMAAHPRSWFEHDYPAAVAKTVGAAAGRDPRLDVFASELYADWLLFEEPQLAGRMAFDTRFELLTSAELRRLAELFDQTGPNWQRAAEGYGLFVLDRNEGPPVTLDRRGAPQDPPGRPQHDRPAADGEPDAMSVSAEQRSHVAGRERSVAGAAAGRASGIPRLPAARSARDRRSERDPSWDGRRRLPRRALPRGEARRPRPQPVSAPGCRPLRRRQPDLSGPGGAARRRR